MDEGDWIGRTASRLEGAGLDRALEVIVDAVNAALADGVSTGLSPHPISLEQHNFIQGRIQQRLKMIADRHHD